MSSSRPENLIRELSCRRRPAGRLWSTVDVLTVYDLAMSSDAAFGSLMREARRTTTERVGEQVNLYVPVYFSNVCSQSCTYCAFRSENRDLKRIHLSDAEFKSEVEELTGRGHRFIEVVAGEGYAKDYVRKVAIAREGLDAVGGGIVAVFPGVLDSDQLVELVGAGADVLIGWQETYEEGRYGELHPGRRGKADFRARLESQASALRAGFRGVGIGFLAGLSDHRTETAALVGHGNRLIEEFGSGPLVVGTPRAKHTAIDSEVEHVDVSDRHLLVQVAICRLAFPSSQIMLSTREDAVMLSKMLLSGASLVNAEASTIPGGYAVRRHSSPQFRHHSYSIGQLSEALAPLELVQAHNYLDSTQLQSIVYRPLESLGEDRSVADVFEFATKPTQHYMIAIRKASPTKLGSNYHRGLFASKDPETVVLVSGCLDIQAEHVPSGRRYSVRVNANELGPCQLTVPKMTYHEVVVVEDAVLLEFSSAQEDSIDSFSLL